MTTKRTISISLNDMVKIGQQISEFFHLNNISLDDGYIAMEFLIAWMYTKNHIPEKDVIASRKMIYDVALEHVEDYEKLMGENDALAKKE